MNDVSLITVDDIKELTSISKNFDSEMLEPYILIAEEFFVYNIIGSALLTELKNQVTGNTVSSLNQVLLNNYIRPLAIYGAWHEASPFLNYKTVTIGVIKQHSDNSENLTPDEFSFYRQSLKDKITFYEKRLNNYLIANKDKYPLFRECYNEENNSTGIYLGVSL